MEERRKDIGAQLQGSPSMATPSKPADNAGAEVPSSRRRGGQKRKSSNLGSGSSSNTSATSSKRLAREKPLVVPFVPIHSGPCTRARQQPNSTAVAAASLAELVKNEEGAVVFLPLEGGGGDTVKLGEGFRETEVDLEALEAKIEADYEAVRLRDANAHVVPTHAGWFSWTKIHPVEERGLPSFFNGKSESRTPEVYMEIRNCIMKKFHANPNVQFELKDLSELSVGEMDTRREVMDFLDYWGLINYHPFPPTDAAAVNTDADGVAKRDSLVDMLYRFDAEQSSGALITRNNVAKPSVPSALFPKSVIAEELTRPEAESVEYHCNSCSADCSRKRYHCQKQADFDLCTECFNNGKFGSGMSPSDFILMEPAEAAGVGGGKWSDQETLLLLEALELFKDNWNEIAEHVATKTKAECILHFVQMPIEDAFLDYDDEIDESVKENADPVPTNNDTSAPKDAPEATEDKGCTNDDQSLSSAMETSKPDDTSESNLNQEVCENIAVKALREAFEAVGSLPSPGEQFSFAEASNPVMALVAFLVRLAEPNIATASVRSSIKSISGNSSGMQLAARHCFILDDPPDDKKKSDDSERADTEMIELEAQKDENHNDEKQKEKSSSVFNEDGVLNNDNNVQNRDIVAEEEGLPLSHDGECIDKSQPVEALNATAARDEFKHPSHCNKSDSPDLPNKQAANTAEVMDDPKSALELHPRSVKESGDGALVGRPSQSSEVPKNDDTKSDSLPVEKKEDDHITSNSPSENEINTVVEEAKDSTDEKKDSMETKDELCFDRIKRAAITAISAAAVKAKLLAHQEEDQIRQLAVLLMEKQLHKLETKLAFFSEMESVVMRAREQLERSKQKLYHERAQIIAARLGIPASSSRPMPQSSPMNRAASAFANLAPRVPMNMTAQRPPMSRPTMASAPTSSSLLPTTVAGSSVQPPMQDKVSSVGMK